MRKSLCALFGVIFLLAYVVPTLAVCPNVALNFTNKTDIPVTINVQADTNNSGNEFTSSNFILYKNISKTVDMKRDDIISKYSGIVTIGNTRQYHYNAWSRIKPGGLCLWVNTLSVSPLGGDASPDIQTQVTGNNTEQVTILASV